MSREIRNVHRERLERLRLDLHRQVSGDLFGGLTTQAGGYLGPSLLERETNLSMFSRRAVWEKGHI